MPSAAVMSASSGPRRSDQDAAGAKPQSPIRAIIGASSGNLVEWFDFYAYAFTSVYFAASFFPNDDPTSQLLNTAGIFAVGFFMRPLGGWLFGRIADKFGRRTSMLISILMMCFGSLMVACLPTFNQVGYLAPALLLLARLIQGLSVGGEYGTSATYMSEVATQGRRGFYASFQYVTLIGGQLLASLVLVVLTHVMPKEDIMAWGWRIPFVIGALAAVVALILRRSLHETTSSASRKDADAGTIRGVLKHPRALFIVFAYTAGGSLAFYTYTTYMQKYLVNTAQMAAETANEVMTAALLCFMLIQPLFGALSDRIGRRTSMICFSVAGMVMTVPVMTLLGEVQSPFAAFGLIFLALVGVTFYTSVSGLVKAEMFPAQIRALAVGLSYAIGNAAFGGSAEYLALWLKSIGWESTFFWYVVAVCGMALVACWVMPDSRKEGYLQGHGSD